MCGEMKEETGISINSNTKTLDQLISKKYVERSEKHGRFPHALYRNSPLLIFSFPFSSFLLEPFAAFHKKVQRILRSIEHFITFGY